MRQGVLPCLLITGVSRLEVRGMGWGAGGDCVCRCVRGFLRCWKISAGMKGWALRTLGGFCGVSCHCCSEGDRCRWWFVFVVPRVDVHVGVGGVHTLWP